MLHVPIRENWGQVRVWVIGSGFARSTHGQCLHSIAQLVFQRALPKPKKESMVETPNGYKQTFFVLFGWLGWGGPH